MGDLRFSGHESFQCRNLWLKKGFDFIKQGPGDFSSEEAVLSLGVGKNMTTSIRFWMDAFGIREKNEPSTLAEKLLGARGWDPYLEDLGSLWLLHYLLVSRSKASIYHLVFNRFRKRRIEFTKDHLITFLISYCEEKGESHSPNTIASDVGVFLKTYVKPNSKIEKGNIEDLFSSLFIELSLVKEFQNIEKVKDKEKWYIIESSERESLPLEIFFYSILDNIEKGNYSDSISLHKLLSADHSPGNVFALHPDALISKVERLVQRYSGLSYKEDGGVRELQIQQSFNKNAVLDEYYARS